LKIIIISAIAQNGVIGRSNGEMPWHVKEEFQHFKQTTLGFPILMGRKTFETLGKPLKGRENILITRDENYSSDFEEVKIIHSLSEGIEYCKITSPEKIFIIGGGEVYKQAIEIADQLIISNMKFDAEGEINFPEISENDWEEEYREDREKFEIVKYTRKR
jgi:dihydrofolate reductase